jgi:hypothetical protein
VYRWPSRVSSRDRSNTTEYGASSLFRADLCKYGPKTGVEKRCYGKNGLLR